MINELIACKKIYFILFFWLIIGVSSSYIALVIIPLHLFFLKKENRFIIAFLGFWFILILSDSYQRSFAFAAIVKPFLVIALFALLISNLDKIRIHKFYKPFIPFFLFSIYCLLFSPIIVESIQKTLSYFLLLLIIPSLINYLIYQNKDLFLKNFILLGSLILVTGIVFKYFNPSMVIFLENRFNGIFGNPNGLGMFSFLFFSIFSIISYYYPYLFKNWEKYFVYTVIILSLIWSGSRGGIFSTLVFILGSFIFKKSSFLGLIVFLLIFIAYQFIIANLESIVTFLNLQIYFRLDTLISGSGRDIAFDFAFKNIQDNFWVGKGFGYGEHLMQENQEYFQSLGHIGNAHNSFLTIWLDSGLIGLIFFVFGWGTQFLNAWRNSFYGVSLLFAVLLSANVESWLAASLNPFTILLVSSLTLLTNLSFLNNSNS